MTTSTQARFWVNIIPLDHAQKGIAGGHIQGTKDGLDALSLGDMVIFYSPRTRFRQGKPLQQFTALGIIKDSEPYQTEGPGERFWQRRIEFQKTQSTKIEPLVENLTFLPDKEKWGIPYSKGIFEIDRPDFELIAEAMAVKGILA